MALAGSAWKHVSSSGVSTRLGARASPSPGARASSGFWPPRASPRRGARLPKCRRLPLGRAPWIRAHSAGVLLSGPHRQLSFTSGAGASIPGACHSAARASSTPSAWGRRRGSPPWVGPRAAPRTHTFQTRHRMRQDYPLNLSISLSGGEETNQDAPSNGE